ncbi:MAG: LysR family transcriptional regulator [Pseudomonadota bacterium]
MLDWNDIPFFLAVAETGSLSGAANKLAVNHSTVFRRINSLENKLGVRLFDRLPEGYSLTETGHSALDFAYQAENSLISFERNIEGHDYRLTGEIRVSAPYSMATKILAPCISKFHSLQPSIKINVLVSDALHDLSRRDADIALRATSNPPDYLLGRQVTDFKWHVYAGHSYLKKQGIPKSMKSLHAHQLIGPDDSLLRIDVYKWLKEHFSTDNFTAYASDLSTIAALCHQGLGVAILPSDYIEPRLNKLFAVNPAFSNQLWILSHPDLRHVSRIRVFTDFLYNFLKKQNF